MRKEGFFRAYQNQEIFYQSWHETETPKGVILITHGMGEHSESYRLFCEAMLPQGFTIYAYDLRGHGRSEGKRGVASLREMVEDLKAVHRLVSDREKDLPIFLLGHSMGGLILFRYLLQDSQLPMRAAIFSSPLLGLSLQVPVIKDVAARLLHRLAPGFTLGNEIDNQLLSHDLELVKSYDRDPLRHTQVCPGLYLDFLAAFADIDLQAQKISTPILMQLAGDDQIVSRGASERVFANLGSEDKCLKIYDGFYHEIYNEVERHLVYRDLTAWLQERC